MNTIPHIPCGRALNVYLKLFEEVIKRYTGQSIDEERLWRVMLESAEQGEKSELEIDMSFFENSVTTNTKGSISKISEENLSIENLMYAIFEQMAENYYEVSRKLVDDFETIDTIIFSGGVANKNSFLRELIAKKFEGCQMKLASNETFIGLWKYVRDVYNERLFKD